MKIEIGMTIRVRSGRRTLSGCVTGKGQKHGQTVVDYVDENGFGFWCYASDVLSAW